MIVRRNKILLIVPQDTGEPGFFPGGQVTAANGLIDYLASIKIDYEVINLVTRSHGKNYIIGKFLGVAYRFLKLIKALKDRNVSCVLVFGGALSGIPDRVLMCMLSKIFHTPSSLFLRNSGVMNLENDGIKRYIVSILLRSPDLIFVQGENVKNIVSGLGRKRNVHVIRNWLPVGVNVSDTHKCYSKSEDMRVIFVGRMVKSKGVFDIIAAAKKMEGKYNIHFDMVGDGAQLDELKNLVTRDKLSNLKFHGWKSRVELYQLLYQSHVFLLPTYHDEGLPNSLLEAMCFGLPAIVTDIGAINETIKNGVNGFIVKPKSPEDLVCAIKKYFDDQTILARHSVTSLETVAALHNRDINCSKLIKLMLETKDA